MMDIDILYLNYLIHFKGLKHVINDISKGLEYDI